MLLPTRFVAPNVWRRHRMFGEVAGWGTTERWPPGGRHELGSEGAVAQLGEHRLCKPRVVGSSPIGSTQTVPDTGMFAG